ncbi:C40 family peptidase [Nocardioides speluncae]|uniref:C40 family peptidase n=1 Tax=Nocardioides speluncae TaxID=2670337 RepID=UPI000D687092|nr:C40 family peptidase [Nocardioides speluncae]
MLSTATATTMSVATTTPAEAVTVATASDTKPDFQPAASTNVRQMSRTERVLYAQQVAKRQIGDWYRYGSAGPDTFDCSGLTMYSYAKAGIRLPRTSDGQAAATRRVSKRNLRRGDLMFFHSGGNVYHVAMFLKWQDGHVVMVHAGRTGEQIRRDVPWTTSWFGGTLRPRKPEQQLEAQPVR